MGLLGDFTSGDENTDFTPGSVMKSSEVDANFDKIQSFLGSPFVDDASTAASQLTGDRIKVGTMDGDRISDNSIQVLQMGVDSVGSTEIQTDGVTTLNILDGAVTNDKINDLDGAKLQAGTVSAASLGTDVQFPLTVTAEVIQFPALGAAVPLQSSNVNETGISVYPAGMPGSPYTKDVHWSFVGPNSIQQIDNGPGPGDIPILTNIEVDYNAATFIPPGSVATGVLADNAVTNVKVDTNADIELSKLDDFIGGVRAVTPTAGALTGTLGNSGIAVDAVGSTQIAANAVTAAEIAPNAVGASEIADNSVGIAEIGVLPVGRIWRTGSGTAGTPNTWTNVRYPSTQVQGGIIAWNDGTNIAGFQVVATGWYNVTVSAEFLQSSASDKADAIGVRIRNISTGETLSKDVQAWNPTGTDANAPNIAPGAGCAINVKLTAGQAVIGQFISIGSGATLIPDVDSNMSIAWVSS